MQYLLYYLMFGSFFGLIFTIIASIAIKRDSTIKKFTKKEHMILILLWPIYLIIFINSLIKNISNA